MVLDLLSACSTARDRSLIAAPPTQFQLAAMRRAVRQSAETGNVLQLTIEICQTIKLLVYWPLSGGVVLTDKDRVRMRH